MNKDVIYIDVDDDVTAIIGKIKKAKENVVALVPPKRAGTLQSAVNLRLLQRMAKNDKKQLVLVTNNHALVGLAASAEIPVAKNLQSKPELPEVTAVAVDNGDDIIDGSQIPVGEHAATVKVTDGTKVADETRSDAIDTTDLNIDGEDVALDKKSKSATAVKKGKNRPKIPNFNTFRKKLFLGIAGGVALIALLIWMFVFAPAATVIITASTTPVPVSSSVILGGTEATNYEKGIISSVSQQETSDETVQFDATGQRDVGNQAAGSVRLSTVLLTALGTIPAGTELTSTSGNTYTTDQAVTLTASNAVSGVEVGMTAIAAGTAYNGATGSMSGAPSGVNATIVDSPTGGTTQVVKVVTADDVDRAMGQLIGESTDEQKAALKDQFTNGEIIVDSSFTVERGTAVSSPAVDQPAGDGKATLTVPTTYSIQAVPKADLNSYLNDYLKAKLDDPDNQKVYSTGVDDATLSNYRTQDDQNLATVNAVGSVGPKIDEDQVKEQVKGKIYGEVQQSLESVEGIKEVDVQFSYFWVRTVPNNTDKITIQFKVDE